MRQRPIHAVRKMVNILLCDKIFQHVLIIAISVQVEMRVAFVIDTPSVLVCLHRFYVFQIGVEFVLGFCQFGL